MITLYNDHWFKSYSLVQMIFHIICNFFDWTVKLTTKLQLKHVSHSFHFTTVVGVPAGDPAGGGVEWALSALCHPVVSASGQLPAALSARPLPRHAGQNQLHQPGPAPPAGSLQPLQGARRRSHRIRLPQGYRALQARWGQRQMINNGH